MCAKEKSVEKPIEELKDSPLYAMSLGGRELYHSNFWAWLFKKDKEFLKAFIDKAFESDDGQKTKIINLLNNYDYEVEREQGHRDITIWIPENPDNTAKKEQKNTPYSAIVIENKLKSIATLKQLERYKNSVEFELDKDSNIKTYKSGKNNGKEITTGHTFKYGILTGISEDIDLPENWTFLSYDKICEGFEEISKNMIDSKDDSLKTTLDKYIKDTKNISKIISMIVPNKIETWDMKEIDDLSKKDSEPKLSDIRMDDLCKKKWANEFAKQLAKQLQEKLKLTNQVNEYKLIIASGFTNKQPLVEVFYRKGKDDLIGIQIQGMQYRRCFSKSGDKETNLKDTFINLTKVNWFSHYDKNKEKKIEFKYSKEKSEKYSTNQQNNDYCSYKPSFIYQYRNLNKDNCSFEKILESISKDMKFAKEVLQNLHN